MKIMARDTLLEIAYGEQAALDEAASRATYDYLLREIGGSKHGSRFTARSFDLSSIDDERPSALDVRHPYVVTNEMEPGFQRRLATTVGHMIMPVDNWDAFVAGFETVFSDEEVVRHRKLGGSIMFLSNHRTYADIPAESAGSVVAKLNQGEENPNERNDIIVHRLTSLFEHKLIRDVYDLEGVEHAGGMIFEDILLANANALQTLPTSGSGYTRLINSIINGKQMRRISNERTSHVYSQLINLGGRNFFIAGSGSEAIDEGRVTYEQTIGRATAAMLIQGNGGEAGTEKVLTIPLFIYADPFTGDAKTLLSPKPTPFAFLRPRFLKKSRDVHDTMEEITAAGNFYKPSGKPTIQYNSPGIERLHAVTDFDELFAYSV